METHIVNRLNGHTSSRHTATRVLAAPARPAVTEAVVAARESRWRRCLFRAARLMVACGLAFGATALVQRHVADVSSDQAYLNGAITGLRAPIGGVLRLATIEPGTPILSGTTLFQVENPRFGNGEPMSQLNWLEELVERLRVDVAEAELRHAKQQELFKHYEALFREKLLPRLQFVEEETKVALGRIALDSRREQLRSAEARRREIERQLALQKQAVVSMPFPGVVWSVRAQNGHEVGSHETVMNILDPARMWVDAFIPEKHADRFQAGTAVQVRAIDGGAAWMGRVESVRGGAGRVDPEQSIAVPAGDLARRRIAVRVKLESPNPFTAREFFGVGRSVKVTLPGHE